MRGLAQRDTTDHRLREVADTHVRTSIDHVVGSDYVGSHWWVERWL